ncbi:MAG: 2-dehydro-3-deoxyglucarate aldolase [Anaerolineaceae bacterium]|nr:2-dehydro-3-deoxyglucarate aldolase [Anaerolineaceae bacterium]
MQTNLAKKKLKDGGVITGSMVRIPDPALVEFLALQGWDFLTFDAEHGTLDPGRCEDLVRAAQLYNVTPLVRVTTNEPPTILRFLDTGAQGLHVPWVNTGEEAERAVQSVKYHPRGIRGLAGVRASTYLQTMTYDEYVRKANAETLTIIQVETIEAVHNLSDILAVPDIDVIFIGRTDLSHSLGHPGQTDHPDVVKAVDTVVDAVLATPAALGVMVGSAEEAVNWKKRGARYIITSVEAMLGPGCRTYLNTVRQA